MFSFLGIFIFVTKAMAFSVLHSSFDDYFVVYFQATHARLMIFLPGFTVSPAEEVKSRNFSFKVYHTGTTFYFAAESEDELSRWVESFARVTVSCEEQCNYLIDKTS